MFYRLSLLQLLGSTEEEDFTNQTSNIFIFSQDETAADTEEDYDDSDQENANPNQLSRGILN